MIDPLAQSQRGGVISRMEAPPCGDCRSEIVLALIKRMVYDVVLNVLIHTFTYSSYAYSVAS